MKRLSSIDATRGLVMLLMLVDHAREFFYLHAQVSDPVDVMTTSPDLFFTRLCAHLCAPVFILLTGLAAGLYENKKSKKETTLFLFKRGLFLIFLELTIVGFGWSFSLVPSTIYLQVIWAIGISMIMLSGLIWLPQKAIIALGLIIIFGHNFLDPISFAPHEVGHALWAIIHDRSFIELTPFMKVRTSYPVLPWIGVILLGYSIGPWFASGETNRPKKLLLTGIGSIVLFVLLRSINQYGDFYQWSNLNSPLLTTMSFLNLTKYPPSLDFLLLTLGIGLVALWMMEKESTVSRYLATYGSTPLFFYVIHIYLLNILNTTFKFFLGPNQGNHLSVPNVISLWIISILVAFPMYYACRWYGEVKRKSPNPILKYF